MFLEPGDDGRETVTGLKVDDQGRLFVAGRTTDRVFVYDTESRELLRSFETAEAGVEVLVNDITFAGEAAYVTDSYRPVLFRIPSPAATSARSSPGWTSTAWSPTRTVST